MENKLYRKRIIDSIIDKYLTGFGAICIEGCKYCGKTWTCREHSNSEIYLSDPSGNFNNKLLANLNPVAVLDGTFPRLIDEWQEAPLLWDAIRNKVDLEGKKGMFILTGSATINRDSYIHSGAGRIARIKMRTMSLFEEGFSTGDISLYDVCNGNITDKLTGDVQLEKLIDYIIRGGWPANRDLDLDIASLLPKQYIDALLNDDIFKADDIKRDKHKVELLLRSLARNESTTATNKTLKSDIVEKDNEDINIDSVTDYLNLFNKLFITNNQQPFDSKNRSSIRIKQSEKRHLCDPSLAVALMNLNKQKLLNDLNTLGFLFEALVERDLDIYSQSFNGKLYHYQDYNNNEIDSVIELEDGSWCAFEIKLGANQIDDAAKNLIKVNNSIIRKGGIPAKTLCVICGLTNAAYKRHDGVIVVPITSLKN